MPQFRYKARNHRGDAISGEIEAPNSDSVAVQLLNSGITPVEIKEYTPRQDVLGDLLARLNRRHPTLDDLVLFCRQMYTLTKAGVPIIRGISGLAESTRNVVLAEALDRMRVELESGRELSTAMNQSPRLFSPLMVSMVRVGENTGQLDEAFLKLSSYLELERDTRNRIKAAMRYPTFVLFAIAAAIVIVNIWVIPAFMDVFASFRMELPWQTKLLLATSNFFVDYWPYLLALLLLALGSLRYYLNTPEGKYLWDKKKLGIPLVGSILSRATLGRFARTFAMTTRAGVPLIQTLTVVSRAVDNDYIAEQVLSMRNGIERGDSLTRTAAASAMFTPLVLQMMAVGEETGGVDDMLDEVADFYEREVDYELKGLSQAIEPILLVAVGVLVLMLALGIFLPMWELTSIAKQ